MEQLKQKYPKSKVYRTFQTRTYNVSRMNTNKDKVPDNQLNSSTNAKLKDKFKKRKGTDPVEGDKIHQSQNKNGQNHSENGEKDNQDSEIEGPQNNSRPRSGNKESLGDGHVEGSEVGNDNRHDGDLSFVGEHNESDATNLDALEAFDADIDNNLPSTVALLTTPGGSKVYVVGTVHYSVKSQDDVARLIRAVQPNYVILELCKTRSVMLQWDEETVFQQAQNMSFGTALRKSFQLGFLEGLFFITLFSLSIRMTKELGIAPGGEFRVAFREAQQVPNCEILFGDLPIALTLQRLFATLSFWQVLKIVTFFVFKNKKMSQDEVEKYRKMDEVEKMLLQFSQESPDIARVLVNERDAVLTYFMQLAAEKGEPNTVVGVVGLGHLMGIKENWGKVSEEEIREIMKIPPPRKYHRVIKFTIKFTAVGLFLYGVHKIASKSSFYRSLFSYESLWSFIYEPLSGTLTWNFMSAPWILRKESALELGPPSHTSQPGKVFHLRFHAPEGRSRSGISAYPSGVTMSKEVMLSGHAGALQIAVANGSSGDEPFRALVWNSVQMTGMKGYKVTDSSRLKMFGVACDSLSNLRAKGSSKLGIKEDVYLALDDGTIIDDEEYFKIIPSQTIIIFYKKSEDVVTERLSSTDQQLDWSVEMSVRGADYILNMLRKINSGYLSAGEKARDFLSDKINDLMKNLAKDKGYKKKSNTRDEDPDWFADLDTNAKTKEEYMFRKSQDRIRGYFYKFYGDVRKNPDFIHDPKPRKELNKCIDYFKRKLKEDKYFGCYFDRRCARMHQDQVDSSQSKDRERPKRWKGENEVKEDDPVQLIYDSYCDSEGRFACQGKWDSKECEFYSKHSINPYLDRESRILFSTWNFDHRIEKSRTILPTLFDVVKNLQDDLVIDYEYFYKLLFTNVNLKLVHVVCHDKAIHDIGCDMKNVYKR